MSDFIKWIKMVMDSKEYREYRAKVYDEINYIGYAKMARDEIERKKKTVKTRK